MGYTHYIETKRSATNSEMEQILNCYSLILKAKCTILESFSTTRGLMFNGRGDDAHETFIFEGSECWDFCKTARKPYDAAVVATLIAIKVAMGGAVRISSDGGLKDWQDGIKLFHGAVDCTVSIGGLDGELVIHKTSR